ncbi:DUF3141 domain-containing protein [Desulforegula conservatrix]|uniref:DUF3141 domain-containing protein n=1 Tax=Desulforegula conservatrix TaxID=153026 RepID=UPI0003FD9227|nr:DUF3141 domain-containing protein [Desulforegula conservatrix]
MTNIFSIQDQLTEYMTDAYQRSVLYWDIMRQRGNLNQEQQEKIAPNVLQFEYELIANGKTLAEPVNYALVRIVPPKGVTVDEKKRPFVVVDPRAGHGPGIGGFKADSEIGVAFKAGHPCYFIGFLPNPEPGQTIEKIMKAEAIFLEKVIERHPKADGKPVVIGNCQAGWAIMMVAATRPELFGPIIVAGSPISYWAGVRGVNPMRYSGGLLGGSWLTALTGDLGNGIFDGAALVQNFENQNPANTLWTKQYTLYEKIDTEPPRYLEFEKWWGGHITLNAEEMQYIVDNLFVGNKLSTGEIITEEGVSVDLRRISSPIICFCSKGDNITPPQQALGWITDLYGSVDDIRAAGQTIVYAVHENIGHLGIFVSGGVAKKEHQEFASNIDFIDCLPPGLYEAVMIIKNKDTANSDLVSDDYISSFEARTLDDIRAMGCNTIEDERCFAAAEKMSQINLGLYRTMLQPLVKAISNEQTAEMLRKTNPLRLSYDLVSDANPIFKNLEATAKEVQKQRKPVDKDNIFWKTQEVISDGIVESLDLFRVWSEKMSEQMFFSIYDNPITQALLGLKASDAPPRNRPGRDPFYQALVKSKIKELRNKMEQGGPREAIIRSIIYVRLPENAPDERAFEMLNRIRKTYATDMSLAELKNLIREQFFMVLMDEKKAIDAIPLLIKGNEDKGEQMLDIVQKTVTAKGALSKALEKRFSEVAKYFTPEKAKK